jgi:hypothetical protein
MLIVGYVFAIRSERLLCREVQVKLAYRWFAERLAESLEQRKPHPSTAARRSMCFAEPVGAVAARHQVFIGEVERGERPREGRRVGDVDEARFEQAGDVISPTDLIASGVFFLDL